MASLNEIDDSYNEMSDRYSKALQLLIEAKSILRGNGQDTLANEIEDFLIYET